MRSVENFLCRKYRCVMVDYRFLQFSIDDCGCTRKIECVCENHCPAD